MQKRGWSRVAWWVVGLGLVAVLLAVALQPTVIDVDQTQVVRGPMVVTIDEEGETRIHRKFVVSAPVTGRLQRIELEPGDPVVAGQTVVARVQAEAPPLLDARSRAEAEAARSAADSTLGRARADEKRAAAELALARRELEREQELGKAGLTSRQALDMRETAVRNAEEVASAATFAVATAASQLQQAEARLRPDGLNAGGRLLNVVAPINGVVLRRLRESSAVVPAGEPLVELGDPLDLEIVSDLLSTDAVQVRTGTRVELEQFGADQTLAARVRRVEPSGFMKISALGVEEQRVNVIMSFDDPKTAASMLGDGYRTGIRIVTWEAESVVQVPTSALFRQGESWAVYVIAGETVRLASVTVGHRNGEVAEILNGVSAGDNVVAHPPDTLSDGATVRVRPRP
jgi:HlyD family secretion protein